MLILTRRPTEDLMIGDDIVVTVLGINRTHVRLGFSAPKHVAVHRLEVYQRIAGEAAAGEEAKGAQLDSDL